MKTLGCVIGFLPLVLGAIIVGSISVTLLIETAYDMAEGFFNEWDLVGGIFGLLLSLVLWHTWANWFGCWVW